MGILLVSSIAGAQRPGRVVRRRPINKDNRGGKNIIPLSIASRQQNAVEANTVVFTASDKKLPPQFAPRFSNPIQATLPPNLAPQEPDLSERQEFTFDNSIPPRFTSFPPSDDGSSSIDLDEFESIGSFQNVQNGKCTNQSIFT